MAVKKFLTNDGKQVWPITRADCIYTVAGDKLLSDDYASKDYIDNEVTKLEEDKASIDYVNNMLSGLRLVPITKAEYESLTEKDPSVLYIVIN